MCPDHCVYLACWVSCHVSRAQCAFGLLGLLPCVQITACIWLVGSLTMCLEHLACWVSYQCLYLCWVSYLVYLLGLLPCVQSTVCIWLVGSLTVCIWLVGSLTVCLACWVSYHVSRALCVSGLLGLLPCVQSTVCIWLVGSLTVCPEHCVYLACWVSYRVSRALCVSGLLGLLPCVQSTVCIWLVRSLTMCPESLCVSGLLGLLPCVQSTVCIWIVGSLTMCPEHCVYLACWVSYHVSRSLRVSGRMCHSVNQSVCQHVSQSSITLPHCTCFASVVYPRLFEFIQTGRPTSAFTSQGE